jgi:hypothetical protein
MNYLWLVGGDSIGRRGQRTEDDRHEPRRPAPAAPVAGGPIPTTDGPFAETKG